MKEALLAGNTEEAKKWAAKLQSAENDIAANPSPNARPADARQKGVPPTGKSKDASGEWIN
jgi:hypothetical protein